jgi:hypothetical protein
MLGFRAAPTHALLFWQLARGSADQPPRHRRHLLADLVGTEVESDNPGDASEADDDRG